MPHMKVKLMGGGVDFKIPNVSYCNDVNDVHFNPYNLIEFYVGDITGTTPQTVKIYTYSNTSVDVTVSEENKWYSYLLPKDKGLHHIGEQDVFDVGNNNIIKKVIVKANISYDKDTVFDSLYSVISKSTVEASFKGSNTSKVTTMYQMFNGCSGLTSLDLSGFDTSNVTSMSEMFITCKSLTSLDLSGFNTIKVTDMGSMFHDCMSLTSLDLSSFDTSNVKDMNSMFNGCSNLTSLDLSNFNTSNVTNMSDMFNTCSNLAELDLSNLNTSNVTNMVDMFNGCTSLRTITMVGCSKETRTKIEEALTAAGIKGNVTIIPT